MGGFIFLLLWLCPAFFIIGAVEDAGGNIGDVGCLAFIPGLNMFIVLAILINGGIR